MIIKLADHIIDVQCLYSYIEEYCKDYILLENEILKESDIRIQICMDDIDYERNKSAEEDRKEGISVRSFSNEYLEILAAYRKIAESLLRYDIILFHGSVIAVDGNGYLFTAKSGTGKSTHTRLWREFFKDRAVMVNDDKPLIKIDENGATVFGTPWDGKHRLSNNISVPLRSICIIERGEENRIERMKRETVYPLILQQTNRPLGKESMMKTMKLVDRMLEVVPVYRLYCNMDIDAAKVAYDGMLT